MTTHVYVCKMAAVTVSAELKFRDGQRERICVKVENNLNSLIQGIHDMNTNVSRLLSELVEREKCRGSCGEGELAAAFPGGANMLALLLCLQSGERRSQC